MESFGIFLILVMVGLLILQIVMIVKFFQIATNVQKLAKGSAPSVQFLFANGEMKEAYNALCKDFTRDTFDLISSAESEWRLGVDGSRTLSFEEYCTTEYTKRFPAMRAKYEDMFEKIGQGHPDYKRYQNVKNILL